MKHQITKVFVKSDENALFLLCSGQHIFVGSSGIRFANPKHVVTRSTKSCNRKFRNILVSTETHD